MFWCYKEEKWCSCWCCNLEKCDFKDDKHITEHEIVSPYLEKLLEEIQGLKEINNLENRYDKGYQHGRGTCEAIVERMISRLKEGDSNANSN